MNDATRVLGAAEEIRLAQEIEAGLLAGDLLARGDRSTASGPELITLQRLGEQAWQRFLLGNVRLVQSIAAQEARRSPVEIDELFQEGFVGLGEALQRWDHRAGYRFSTFATQWIRRRVTDAAAARWVPASVRSVLRARGVRSLADRLTGELHRNATDAELAGLLGRSPRWVMRMRHLSAFVPLERAMIGAGASTPGEPEIDVRALLPELPEVEAEIVHVRFGLDGRPGLGQRPAAEILGISLSTLRRHEARALRRLRGWLLDEQAA